MLWPLLRRSRGRWSTTAAKCCGPCEHILQHARSTTPSSTGRALMGSSYRCKHKQKMVTGLVHLVERRQLQAG